MAKVLFVCLGNICRSPTAEGVFSSKVTQRHLPSPIEVDSAGTAAYHINKSPDERSQREARLRGYDLGRLRARQVRNEDFSYYDYILAMDKSNLVHLQRLSPIPYRHKIELLLPYGSSGIEEVPDPYYGGREGFQHVLDLLEEATEALLEEIIKKNIL